MAVTAVASAAVSTTLLAAGPTYGEVIIENSDANRLHIHMEGGTASTSSYSYSLAQYDNVRLTNVSAAITGIWTADGTGFAHITAR